MPRGPLGLKRGKGHGCGGQEHPEEEDYYSRRHTLDLQEDAPEPDEQTTRITRVRRAPGFRPKQDQRPPTRPPIQRTQDYRGKHNDKAGEITSRGSQLGECQGPYHPGAGAVRSKICQRLECSRSGAGRQEQTPRSLATRGGPGRDPGPQPTQQPHIFGGHSWYRQDGAPGKLAEHNPTRGV